MAGLKGSGAKDFLEEMAKGLEKSQKEFKKLLEDTDLDLASNENDTKTLRRLFPAMSDDEFMDRLKEMQREEIELRNAGKKEYARVGNVFANFNRIANILDLDPEVVLITYAYKHFDGILSYIKGHKSQREHVSGRIADLRVYLAILDAMITAYESNRTTENPETL